MPLIYKMPLGWVLFLAAMVPGFALESSYTVGLEATHFLTESDFDEQSSTSYGLSLESEFDAELVKNKLNFQFTPFLRWDSEDNNREHVDIRELHLLYYQNEWEVLAGVSKVFWGVTESQHLVDIINQTDYLEGFDGEDKLGQTMLRVSRSYDQSTVTFFVLPMFRDREFLSSSNQLSLPFSVSNDSLYEANSGDTHTDYAFRFSGYRGIIDYGFSWFHGTSRDPEYVSMTPGMLTPFYPLIDQLGLDIQITSDAWLWKLEAIKRELNDNLITPLGDYSAAVGGIEYSFYGVREGLFDLGLIAEYNYDSRDDSSAVFLQDDLFLGLRFGFNDAESSELLAGTIIDLEDHSSSIRIEGNRRVFGNARLALEAQFFTNVDETNILSSFQDSDFLRLNFEYFF